MYNCLLKYIVRYIVEQYNELLSNIGQVIFKEQIPKITSQFGL